MLYNETDLREFDAEGRVPCDLCGHEMLQNEYIPKNGWCGTCEPCPDCDGTRVINTDCDECPVHGQ